LLFFFAFDKAWIRSFNEAKISEFCFTPAPIT
jgi:hypothetical protein